MSEASVLTSNDAERVGLGEEVGHGVGVCVGAAGGGVTADDGDDLERCLSVDPCIAARTHGVDRSDLIWGMTHRRRFRRRLRVRSSHEWRKSCDGVAHFGC